ncbi:hypothetical protein EBL89_18295 [Cereibacter sphaeroides]|uniref:hypothetical protein n=2 Tax=Cereibacter TaxID=1653176 RepID=UPI000F534B6A|nr:hypothetical protein [Cereibacter sphaeroides]AZB57243.1 hypothetical protein EBL89_18295 [Cereibacter sphaeroides]AZB61527.1 hypothetical protein EBL88_18405 [Cereibacter sphaeroides]
MLDFIALIFSAATTMIVSTLLFVTAGQAVAGGDRSEARQTMRLAGASLALQAVLWIAAGSQLWR